MPGVGYGSGGFDGGPGDIDSGGPPRRGRGHPEAGRPDVEGWNRISQDNRQDMLGGFHSAAKRELMGSGAYNQAGMRGAQSMIDAVRAARRGHVGPSRAIGTMGQEDNVAADRALQTVSDDFAPLREARSGLQTARADFRAGGDVSHDDVMDARNTFRDTRQRVRGAERRGLTQAEYGARRLSRGGGR